MQNLLFLQFSLVKCLLKYLQWVIEHILHQSNS